MRERSRYVDVRRGVALMTALSSAAALQCSLVAKSDLKAGVGEACSADAECQNGTCRSGACATACAADSDCPSPSLCFGAYCELGCHVDANCENGNLCVANACTAPLQVAGFFAGGTDGEDGWSTAHRLGLDQAAAALPYVQFGSQRYRATASLRQAGDMQAAVTQALTEGADVIVTTSTIGTQIALAEAPKAPGVDFVAASATANGGERNLGAYTALTEQAWYVAGELAARLAPGPSACLGMILPTPTKAIVRDTNAFVRGATHQQGGVKVVIRWVGATKDFGLAPQYSYAAQTYPSPAGSLYREELLAAQLADLGCTVIAHRTETQRVVVAVEAKLAGPVKAATMHPLFSLGADVQDACRAGVDPTQAWYSTCLGAVYGNWGPLYSRIFDQIQRGVWSAPVDAEPFISDPTGVTQIAVSPFDSLTGIDADAALMLVQDAANAGFDAVFTGPYSFTGQRDLDGDGNADANQAVPAGTALSANELERMCWFVSGTWELPDPTVVTYDSLIPALVPYGPSATGGTTTLGGDGASRKKYGDVIDYMTSVGLDPTVAMSCPLD
ncbi:MAG TPA: BMP family ABC transporter substrate-binding protein [Polyangiaceae bacterium]